MKTKILKIKGDWEEVVNDCRATVNKPPLGKEPSTDFKKKILISEHSPIRDISIKWFWEGIKHWVGVHWVRHKWECFVQTQREDRTGVPRDKMPQDEPQNFTGDANVQHLIDTMRKRLCYQASPETRQYAEDLKAAIREYEPEISDVLTTNCVYRGGCPELMQGEHKCRFYETLCEAYPDARSSDLLARYEAYNTFFYKNIWKGGAR